MPDAMTRLLANVGLSDLERRLRDEAIDETTFLDLDDEDLKDIILFTSTHRARAGRCAWRDWRERDS